MSFSFAVIGINHGHIDMQIEQMLEAGCSFKSFYAVEDDLATKFQEKYPGANRALSENEILSDDGIKLILGAGIPSERAEMGMRAMRAGKDVMVDKPGATSLKQLEDLKKCQRETGRIYSIFYCERFHQRSTIKLQDMVADGMIGDVLHVTCIGPHKLGLFERPEWFYKREKYGGILGDLSTHMIDQFLTLTNSQSAEIIGSSVGNFHSPNHPELEDFGDVYLRSSDGSATGYIRVDWLTPAALPTWGDGRLFVQGTKGAIELRKYIDIAHHKNEGENHLYLSNEDGVQYINCNDVPFLYGHMLRDDVLNRTETAMKQDHCFYATELALRAQAEAVTMKVRHNHPKSEEAA